MFAVKDWMARLLQELIHTFQQRLLFVGLQGSYRRGEAHADSDIDAVVILDQVSLADLQAYRAILATMPEQDKACGFFGGKEPLAHWPRHELFQFLHDTLPLHGTLEELLPPIHRSDIVYSVKNAASGLYHGCGHTVVHHPGDWDAIRGFYKSAFFLLQALHYLRTGVYLAKKQALFPLLTGAEGEILAIAMDWEQHKDAVSQNPDRYLGLLLQWSGEILTQEI